MIVSNTMVYRILAITLFANTITAIIIFFIGIFLNMNGFISGFSMTPELMVFVLKSSFSSGDNSFETRDKLSQYGDKLSFSRDVMLTGVTGVILLYLYYRSIIFVFLSIPNFYSRPFCKLVFIMLILLTSPFLSLGHFYSYM